MCEDHRLKHPFTCIISGPRGSGKSSFCINWCKTSSPSLPRTGLAAVFVVLGRVERCPSVDVRKRIQFHEGVLENFTKREINRV